MNELIQAQLDKKKAELFSVEQKKWKAMNDPDYQKGCIDFVNYYGEKDPTPALADRLIRLKERCEETFGKEVH